MQPREMGKRAAFFLVVTAVIGAAVAFPVGTGVTEETAALVIPSHQPENVDVSPPPETGAVTLDANATNEHVVIDAGHGNSLSRAAIAPLVETLTANGHTVTFYRGERSGQSLNATLRSADAFVSITPNSAYSPAQRAGLHAFTEAGGRVLLAAEPNQQTGGVATLLGIGVRSSSAASATGLAGSYGLSFGDGYLYDLERYDVNYRNVYATPTGESSLLAGDLSMTVHEAVPVYGGTTLVETIESAKLSNDRTTGPYPVVSRSGNVLAIGDASLLTTEWATRGENEALVSATLAFLVSGEKEPGAPAPPASTAGSGYPPSR